jgi:hypothetical protein
MIELTLEDYRLLLTITRQVTEPNNDAINLQLAQVRVKLAGIVGQLTDEAQQAEETQKENNIKQGEQNATRKTKSRRTKRKA